MFAALTLADTKKENIFRWIFTRNKPTVTYEKKGIGNDEYYLITCKSYCGKVDYKEIARLSGNQKSRLVISKKINLPKDCEICAYCPDKFNRSLLKNGVLNVLKRASVSPAAIDICLYDACGKDSDFLLSLLPYSVNLTVLTDRPDSYNEARTVALSEYGAPVSISQNPRYIKRSDILIALDALPADIPKCKLIFATASHSDENVISPCSCYIPNDIAKNIPPDFDKTYFYAALCENSLYNQVNSVTPTSFLYRNSEISINRVADIIKNLDKDY